jgi:hypothetical protein
LRLLAEGKIKWAFWPPGYDETHSIPDANAGYGIWVPSEVEDPDPNDNEEGSDDSDGDGDDPETGEESSGSTTSGSGSYQTRASTKFELLSLLDNH